MREKLEQSINRAKKEKKRMKKITLYKTFGSMAAVLAIVLILPNTSQTAAAAMQQIPLLGNLFKVVTVREYQVDEERNSANVKVPQVEVAATDENADSDIVDQAKVSADAINFDINEETNKLIEEFKKSMENEEGYQNIYIDSNVKLETDDLFSLELILYQGSGSGYEQHKHYTVDKKTGKVLSLKDLCGDDYIDTISEEIKTQMREQMAEDINKKYWVDDAELGQDFVKLAENHNFYWDENEDLVIVFDKYEVAPGYMGTPEFTVSKELIRDVLNTEYR